MPGLQLVSFDPKTSISMIGVEAFESDEILDEVATRAAHDVGMLNQEACVCSRVLFVEGDRKQVDRFCERLQQKLVDRNAISGKAPALPRDIAEEVETLRMMDDEFGVWGVADGSGLVVLSAEPVDFHPINKTANVVPVKSLKNALKYVNVATQTVGVYPAARMPSCAMGWRAAVLSASSGWATPAGSPSAHRTTPCTSCTASSTGSCTKTASLRMIELRQWHWRQVLDQGVAHRQRPAPALARQFLPPPRPSWLRKAMPR